MKTLTVKVTEELDTKLSIVAGRSGGNKSALVREAIENMLLEAEEIAPNSCLDLANDLLGSVEGPQDLSINKKYLEDYGR